MMETKLVIATVVSVIVCVEFIVDVNSLKLLNPCGEAEISLNGFTWILVPAQHNT